MENFLPGFDAVKPVSTGSPGSLRDAARPWSAAIDAGNQLASIGNQGVQLAVKQKELEAKRKAAEMEMAFEQMKSEYEREMLSNPNMTTEQANEGWNQRSQQFLSQYNAPEMSQLERDTIGLRAMSLAQRGSNDVMEKSMMANIQRTKQAAMNMIASGEENGDYERVDNGYAMLNGIISDEEIEALRIKTDRNLAMNSAAEWITDDPFTALWMLNNDEARFMRETNVPFSELGRFRSMAESAASKAIGSGFDQFNDEYATAMESNKTFGDDDVDRIAGHLPPRVVADMKAQLADRNKDDTKKFYKSAAGQAQAFTRLQQIFETYPSVGGDSSHALIGEAKYLVSMLPDSPFNEFAKIKITEMTGERKSDYSDVMTRISKDIENVVIPTELGTKMTEPKRQTTSDILQSGFLRNRKNLQRLGMPEKVIEQMLETEKENGVTKFVMKDTERLRIFQAYYEEGKKSWAKDLSPYTKAAAEALKTGRNEIEFIDPKDQESWMRYQQRSWSVKAAMLKKAAEYRKANPQATYEDVRQAAMSALDGPENESYSNIILGE